MFTRFKEHIEKQAATQKLTPAAFRCSKCSREMSTVDKPRITKNCQHLYCFKCIADVRAQQKRSGKVSPEKLRCIHKNCSSTTGPVAILDKEDIRGIKNKYGGSLHEEEDDDDEEEEEGETLAEKTDEDTSDSDTEARSKK